MEDKWLSVDEITEYLGVSRDTIYNWISSRRMPAHRVGRLWKFKKGAVDAWVESGGANTVGGNEPEPGSSDRESEDDASARSDETRPRDSKRGKRRGR